MSQMEFDPIDMGLTVAGLMAGFIVVGIGSFDLFGVQFGATVTTVAGFALSTAWVIHAGSIVGTILTNDNAELDTLLEDAKDLGQYYYIAVIATLALPIAWLVFPSVPSFFQSADLWGLVYVGLTTTGQFSLGWLL